MPFDPTTAVLVEQSSGKFDPSTAVLAEPESFGQMLLRNAQEAGKKTYGEVISPLLSGVSTFAAGIPKMTAKATGADKIMYPEQQTLEGKALRGISEAVGFTTGLPMKGATLTARALGNIAAKRNIPKIATRLAQGIGGGAVGGALAGDTLENRKIGSVSGAVLGGVSTTISPFSKWLFNKSGKIGATISGIEKEVFEEAKDKGFKNVLQSKYYNKKLPSQIQDRIAMNLENMESAASDEYDKLITPLKKSPFDMSKLRGEVIKIANRVKGNPFDTDNVKLDQAIMDGIVNKAEVNNLGEALDLRRNLDDIIYSNKGELRSSFGKKVRDLLNKELHKNEQLTAVDKEWTNFLDVLRESKKVLSDTGEKILDRFGGMTDKQKAMLVSLENKIGGMPFVEDLTNYSLAKEFTTKKVGASITGLGRAATKPVLRGYLRQGESLVKGLERFDKERVGKLLGEK